MVTAIKKQK